MMDICFFFANFAKRMFLSGHPIVSEDKDMRYVDVILPLPLDGTFTYSIPAGMEEKVVPGMRVLVPLGKSKKYIAMVADVHSEKPDFACKPIDAVLDENPSLLPQQYRLWQWISSYYMS